MLDNITPVILTYNEESNIGRTLEKLWWARDVVVVDSFSEDETLEIISSFKQVRVVQRRFDNFAAQCNYALDEAGIKTDWVLNLDADYVLTDEFIEELRSLKHDDSIKGYRASFKYCIHGRKIRCGIYPPVAVLFERVRARFVVDGHAHRVVVEGKIADLQSPILHDDRKSLRRWFQSQINYTHLEAHKLRVTPIESLSTTDRIRRWRIFAPGLMLFYCLIVRGGILDGWTGIYYAVQRVFAELMLSLYLLDDTLSFGSARKNQEELVGEGLSQRVDLESKGNISP